MLKDDRVHVKHYMARVGIRVLRGRAKPRWSPL
jgi:hypothetical protein